MGEWLSIPLKLCVERSHAPMLTIPGQREISTLLCGRNDDGTGQRRRHSHRNDRRPPASASSRAGLKGVMGEWLSIPLKLCVERSHAPMLTIPGQREISTLLCGRNDDGTGQRRRHSHRNDRRPPASASSRAGLKGVMGEWLSIPLKLCVERSHAPMLTIPGQREISTLLCGRNDDGTGQRRRHSHRNDRRPPASASSRAGLKGVMGEWLSIPLKLCVERSHAPMLTIPGQREISTLLCGRNDDGRDSTGVTPAGMALKRLTSDCLTVSLSHFMRLRPSLPF